MGALIRRYMPAWRIEIEKIYAIVLFNYLFSNGDAPLKNFALLESDAGDYLLSPAYDLINTTIHVDDTDFTLDNGLFIDTCQTDEFRKIVHASYPDFVEFGKRIGVNESRIQKIIAPFLEEQALVDMLIHHSFLNEKSKKAYLLHYRARLNRLIQR